MDVTGDVVMTTWTRTSEERFLQLVGSVTPRMKEFRRRKEVKPPPGEEEQVKRLLRVDEEEQAGLKTSWDQLMSVTGRCFSLA